MNTTTVATRRATKPADAPASASTNRHLRTAGRANLGVVRMTAAASLLLVATTSTASVATISAVTWSTQSSQSLTKSNAGSLMPGSSSISLGYSTGYGNGGGGGSQLAGTTNLLVDFNVYQGTNYFLGSDTVMTALRIGFGTNNAGAGSGATNLQTFTFSQAVTDPYIFIAYAQNGVVYDFSAYTTTVLDSFGVASSVVGSGPATGRRMTGNVGSPNDLPNVGFILQLTGTFTQIQFNIDATNRNSTYASSLFTIAAPLSAAPVPGTGLACLATLGFAGMSRRRRR